MNSDVIEYRNERISIKSVTLYDWKLHYCSGAYSEIFSGGGLNFFIFPGVGLSTRWGLKPEINRFHWSRGGLPPIALPLNMPLLLFIKRFETFSLIVLWKVQHFRNGLLSWIRIYFTSFLNHLVWVSVMQCNVKCRLPEEDAILKEPPPLWVSPSLHILLQIL